MGAVIYGGLWIASVLIAFLVGVSLAVRPAFKWHREVLIRVEALLQTVIAIDKASPDGRVPAKGVIECLHDIRSELTNSD
jgi:hypothetical protein